MKIREDGSEGVRRLKIVTVDQALTPVYMNLMLAYEAEFSAITRKKPLADGSFALDTELGADVTGYLLYVDAVPAGFAAIAAQVESSPCQYEVCEFYIVPCFRRQDWGKHFAFHIWNELAGNWEVKQINGADKARIFWQSIIHEFTQGEYQEDIYQDPYWGEVIRQTFTVKTDR